MSYLLSGRALALVRPATFLNLRRVAHLILARSMRRLLVGALFVCCSCAAERVREGASIPEAELRQLVLGHWYLTSMPHPETPLPGSWEEFDYRADGSCVRTTVAYAIDPRTNKQVPFSRTDQPGKWTLSRDIISHRWKGVRAVDELRIRHISPQHLDLEDMQMHGWQTYSRKFDEKI